MRTNARVGRSLPKPDREGPASLAVAAVLMLVRLSALLGPAFEREAAAAHGRLLGR